MKKTERQELEKRILELTTLYDFSKHVHSVLDFEECIRIIIDKVVAALGVEMVSLMMLDENRKELSIKLARGLHEDIVRESRVKLGKGVSGWVAKKGKPLLISNIAKDARFQKKKDGKYYTDSLLTVPLKAKDRVIGVINVNNKVTREVFIKDDLKLLTQISDQAAVAIHNAILHDEAKEMGQKRLGFISTLSHELRTPITLIKEAISLILDRIAGEINEKQHELLSRAKKSIDRLSRLLNNILDFAKMEAERHEMRRQLVDMADLSKEVIESFRQEADKKSISLEALLPRDPLKVWADWDKINQVLTNLLGNALTFTQAKGRVALQLEDDDTQVKVTVTDTGVGIPPDQLDKIFDKFYRLNNKLAGREVGAGLGLPITKEIIQIHNGRIWVESKPGKGSKFIFTLPKDIRTKPQWPRKKKT